MGGAYRYLIGFLCAAALLLIVAIGVGSDFDETEAKVIGSALAFAFCCLTGMAGVNLANRRPPLALFGYLAAVVSLLAFLAVISAMWIHGFEDDGGGWRIAGIGLVLALAGGHASLLLSSAQRSDGDAVRLVRGGTLIALAMLSAIAVVELAPADGRSAPSRSRSSPSSTCSAPSWCRSCAGPKRAARWARPTAASRRSRVPAPVNRGLLRRRCAGSR